MAAMTEEPAFSEELLDLYYKRLFPYDEMFDWFSYGNSPTLDQPGNVKDFFYRREWSFTLADDIYIRYNCFHDAAEMKAAMVKKQPHKIDIGAVFNLPPKDHLGVSAASFKTCERELVFDIDLTDYDDVRTCCSGAKICMKCWSYMNMAIACLDPSLKEDFGFKDIVYIYSGRRGVHCWVCDPKARELSNEARSAVVEYLSVRCGGEGVKKAPLRLPLHPFLDRSFQILKPMFTEYIASDEGQAIFGGDDRWKRVLATLPEECSSIRNDFEKLWSRKSDQSSSSEKWAQLENRVLEVMKAHKKGSVELEKWYTELVFTHCYPRLDENVSKMQNHLLKSPFCVHPKTGRVCVPIQAEEAFQFNPMTVPTLATLVSEINAYDSQSEEGATPITDVHKTTLGPYITSFNESFLKPMHSRLKKQRRQQLKNEAEQEAAQNGDF